MKVVINACFGGFSLSRAAFLRLRELGQEQALKEPDYGEPYDDGSIREEWSYEEAGHFLHDIDRTDPLLVQVVSELGKKVNGVCAALKVVEVPDDIEWVIDEYDGNESVEERHRSWS